MAYTRKYNQFYFLFSLCGYDGLVYRCFLKTPDIRVGF